MVISTRTPAHADHEPLVYVPIESVRVNPKRLRKLSAAKIRQYGREYDAGDEFPPIAVVANNEFFVIRDGRHRYQAQLACGYRFIAVRVVNV